MPETRRWQGRLRRSLAVITGPALVFGAVAAPVAHATPADDIRVNEVVTTGDVDDSIELYNNGTTAVDVSGWILKDDKDSSKYKIASATVLAPGGAKAFDVHDRFGLGSEDQARLYLADGATLVDSFSWKEHSGPSWSRCPDGTGAFTEAPLTLGTANHCGGTTDPSPTAWPGSSSVTTADAADVFGEDLSGLYQEGGVMWAAQNSGKIWRLVPNGSGGWKPDTAGGWGAGKKIRYPGGSGSPDDEGITLTGAGSSGGVYTSNERNGDESNTSRMSVLRYDVSGTASSLSAAKEWNLTDDLPSVDANSGLEGVTWIPDASLTSAGFKDSSTGAAYDPGRYAAHTGGVFFVGVEGTGTVYGYVLQDSGAFTRVATISSGMSGVMELQWEPRASRLWVVCDDTCDGRHQTMQVNGSGAFATTAVHQRPSGMPNYNNEGFSVAAAAECTGGTKPVYWSDDSNDDKHALRKGSISC